MSEAGAKTSTVIRVSGPIVEADGMAAAQAYEMVKVGPAGLVGEIIKLDGGVATIQVYEHTGGLAPGAVVRRTRSPLSVVLGPGLLGGIFDGVQRPLDTLARQEGPFLSAGRHAEPLSVDRRYAFRPKVSAGDELQPGAIFGVVQETPSVEHRLLISPVAGGRVADIKGEGEYAITDTVCTLEGPAGRIELAMSQKWPVRRPRPFRSRMARSDIMVTGQRVIDTFFPVARGGAGMVPGDFGTGKTMLQQQLAKWSAVDVVVYVGCGERGNEMADILRTFPELQDPHTGRSLMERTVLVANTSNMPVAAREVSIFTGITIAEYYRDMGYNVALMADSTSRWAEALREASSRLEEMPAEEGYPPYLAARLAEFYERAGRVRTLSGREGSVTVIGAVSPPAGDFAEPVTQHSARFTRCFWALDPDLAYSRHYPAVNWLSSYSEYVDEVEDWWQQHNPGWRADREEMMRLLVEEDRLQQIVRLVGPDVLPDAQRLVLMVAEMFKTGYLQQDAMDEVDTYCDPPKQVLLLEGFVTFYRVARRIIARGAPISRLRELDVLKELVRAKSTIRNGEEEALRGLLRRVEDQLGQLAREYS